MKAIGIKKGERVNVWGHIGTVTDVYHGINHEWKNGLFYEIPGTEYEQVTVAFDEGDSWKDTKWDGETFGDFERI